MAEYIDKTQAIIEMIDNNVDHAQGTDGREVVQILSDIPVADVAPVVRCKDCESYIGIRHWCGLNKIRMFDDDFCSYGMKREE